MLIRKLFDITQQKIQKLALQTFKIYKKLKRSTVHKSTSINHTLTKTKSHWNIKLKKKKIICHFLIKVFLLSALLNMPCNHVNMFYSLWFNYLLMYLSVTLESHLCGEWLLTHLAPEQFVFVLCSQVLLKDKSFIINYSSIAKRCHPVNLLNRI